MSLPLRPNTVVGTRLLDLISTTANSNEVATFGFSNSYGVQLRFYDSNLPALGGILRYNSSNSVVSLSRDYLNPVYVGINTTRPAAELHVVGDVTVTGTFSTCNLTVTGSSSYFSTSSIGVVNTLSIYQPTGTNTTPYKTILTNDAVSANCILFTTTLTAGKYLISLNTPYQNKDPSFSFGTTVAKLGLYSATTATFDRGLQPLQAVSVPVSTTTDEMSIEPSFFVDVASSTTFVIAVVGQGQTLQFGGNTSVCSANVITLSGLATSSSATSTRQPFQIAPLRQTYIASAPSSQLKLTASGFYQLSHASNVEVYRNGFKLAYLSATSNDYRVSYFNNSPEVSTTFTVDLTTPLATNDVVDVSVWPEVFGNVSLQSGYAYQNIYNTWSNIPSLNINSSTQFVGIGTFNPPQRLSVVGQSYFSSNVGIGTAYPTSTLDVVSTGQLNTDTSLSGGSVIGASSTKIFNSFYDGINPYSITTDASGNIYTTGYYIASTNLSLSNLSGTYSPCNLRTTTYDVGLDYYTPASYIIQYSSAGIIQKVSYVASGDVNTYIQGTVIKTDSVNNIYTFGYYNSPTIVSLSNLDNTYTSYSLPTTLASGTIANPYIIKYSSSGLLQQTRTIRTNRASQITCATIDPTNNLYVAGFYNSTTLTSLSNLDGTYSPYTLPIRNTTAYRQVPFIINYSSTGSIQGRITLDFTTSGSGGTEQPYDIKADTTGNIYLTGQYYSQTSISVLNFNGTSSGYTLPSTTGATSRYYLIKYSPYGFVQGQATILPVSTGTSISSDNSGNIYVLGSYIPTGAIISLYNLDGSLSSYSLPALTAAVLYYPFVICYSSSGIITMASYLGFIGYGSTININSSGTINVFATISSTSFNGTVRQIYNLDGTLSPYKIYPSGTDDNACVIIYSPSGKVKGVSSIPTRSGMISTLSPQGNIYTVGSYGSTTITQLYNLTGTVSSYTLPNSGNLTYAYTISYSPTSLNNVSTVSTPTPLSVQQSIVGQEFPPVGISNIYFAPDYTDTYESIDIGRNVSNLEYPPSAMNNYSTYLITTYGAGTYTASSGGEYSTGYNAWKAFDKTNGGAATSVWVGAGTYTNGVYGGSLITYDINNIGYTGDWLQLQLPVGIILTNYSINVRSDGTGQNPYTWYVFGSLDGLNWRLMDSRTAFNFALNETRPFSISFPSTTAFSYYRIVVNATSPAGGLNNYATIGEWRLFTNTALGLNRYPKYKATIPYYTSQSPYGLGQYQIWANTIQDYSFSNQAIPSGLFNKTVGNTSNTVWASYSNVYTSTVDAVSSNLPIIYAQFPDALQLTSYSLTARGGNALETPSKWTLFGSNTALTSPWQSLDTESNITSWVSFQTSNFAISTTTAYNFYKIELYRNSSPVPTRMSLGELRFYANKQTPESRLTISTNGFVGIGTTNPQTTMDIRGDLSVSGNLCNSLMRIGPNVFFDGSSNAKNTFLNWLQYVTSIEYRYALHPRKLATNTWWNTNNSVSLYDTYTYSTVATGLAPNSASYLGCILVPDGRVIFVPHNNTIIGIFNPSTNTYSTIGGAPGTYAYLGGVLAPDGRVVFVPYNATTIGLFNPSTNTYSTVAGAPGGGAYDGGVLLPDGRILFVPLNVANIGLFNPTTNTYTTISISAPAANYYYVGGVLLPDGRVVFVPHNSTVIGIFNPTTNSYSTIAGVPGGAAFCSGVLVPDGRVVFVPQNSTTFGIFNPTTNTYSTIPGAPGSAAYQGGTLLPDGRVVMTPQSSTTFGIFNPTTNTYSTITGAPGSTAYTGCILIPDGRVIMAPFYATTIGILTPTQLVRPPPLELAFHPCFNKF